MSRQQQNFKDSLLTIFIDPLHSYDSPNFPPIMFSVNKKISCMDLCSSRFRLLLFLFLFLLLPHPLRRWWTRLLCMFVVLPDFQLVAIVRACANVVVVVAIYELTTCQHLIDDNVAAEHRYFIVGLVAASEVGMRPNTHDWVLADRTEHVVVDFRKHI